MKVKFKGVSMQGQNISSLYISVLIHNFCILIPVISVLFQCNPYVLAAYNACLEKRSVVNFIAVDFFEKHARMIVETALSGNREES